MQSALAGFLDVGRFAWKDAFDAKLVFGGAIDASCFEFFTQFGEQGVLVGVS